MTDQHPLEKARITRDRDETGDYLIIHDASPNHPAKPDSSLVGRVAQWGYDQRGEVNDAELQQARDEELEACCEWLSTQSITDALCDYDLKPIADDLRAARRPNPPSLKKQALEALDEAIFLADDDPPEGICSDQADIIRRALEALPDD